MMLSIQMIIATACFVAGMFFCLTTIVGMYRLPDFYARCHSSGTSETLALMLICIGFVVYSGFSMISIKICILFFIVCACNPIGSHVLARAAYKNDFPMTLAEKKEEM